MNKTQVVDYKNRLSEAVSNAGKHDIFIMASSLAYTTALALAPFILIILSMATLLSPDLQQNIYEGIVTSAGESAGQAILGIIKSADRNPQLTGISGVIGLIVLSISASAIFTQLKIALDKINEHADAKAGKGLWNMVKRKIFSLGLVFGFAFLSVASVVFTMVITVLYPDGLSFLWGLVSFVVNFSLFVLVLTAIYWFVPTDRASFKSCLISGAISTCFYLVGKRVIGLYLGSAGLESSYGAAGSLIVLLVWVYYTTLTLLFSYEFTRDVILKSRPK